MRAEALTDFFSNEVKNNISINISGVSVDSPVRIELLDRRAQPIPAFSGEHAAVISENGAQIPVRWNREMPQAEKLALRVSYPAQSQAKVFALYMTE